MKLLSDIFQIMKKHWSIAAADTTDFLACLPWKCRVQFKETLQEDAVIWIYSEGHGHLPGSALKDSPVTLTTGRWLAW